MGRDRHPHCGDRQFHPERREPDLLTVWRVAHTEGLTDKSNCGNQSCPKRDERHRWNRGYIWPARFVYGMQAAAAWLIRPVRRRRNAEVTCPAHCEPSSCPPLNFPSARDIVDTYNDPCS